MIFKKKKNLFSISVKFNMDILSINTDIKPTNVTHKQYFKRNKHSQRNTIADFQICWPLLIR